LSRCLRCCVVCKVLERFDLFPCSRALEELAHRFSLHHEGDLDRFYELRQYYAEQLVRVITTLIVRFEGQQTALGKCGQQLTAVMSRTATVLEGRGEGSLPWRRESLESCSISTSCCKEDSQECSRKGIQRVRVLALCRAFGVLKGSSRTRNSTWRIPKEFLL